MRDHATAPAPPDTTHPTSGGIPNGLLCIAHEANLDRMTPAQTIVEGHALCLDHAHAWLRYRGNLLYSATHSRLGPFLHYLASPRADDGPNVSLRTRPRREDER